MLRLPFAAALLLVTATLPAQNSTRKVRTAPSATAARAGSAVPWRKDLTTALAEAKEQGKLVFWYVPSVAGSPMDRKAEIDRYAKGGPFSWPTTIDLLTTRFVPVAEVARRDAQKKFGLARMEFVEPGYLVLDGDGNVQAKVDQLTTFHPEWFEAPLRRLVQAPSDGFPGNAALREAWDAYRRGDRSAASELANAVIDKKPADAVLAEARWLVGAAACRDGRRSVAVETWQRLATDLPEQPFAWKAALEAEGHGPFARGFEDYLPLPAAVLATDPQDGSRAPEKTFAEAELWQRGVAFLLAMDDGDGCLRDSTYDFGGTDGLPNVHAAVTCLAGEALLAASARQKRGELELAPAVVRRLDAMLDRIRKNVEAEQWLALSDRDEIVWPRAYALRFLAAWGRHRAADVESLRPALQAGVGALLALQPETGVWFHEYGNPFAIATALQALRGAADLGVAVDQDRIDRGVRALLRNRTKEGAFSYGHTERGEPEATFEGAAGRMPLCELAAFLFGASDQARLAAAIETGHRFHGLLAAVRKYDDHADRHHNGGFFFWFDVVGRADAIARVDDRDRRIAFAERLHDLVLALPEFDGCFVDSHELGRGYGTAMALLCLEALAGARR